MRENVKVDLKFSREKGAIKYHLYEMVLKKSLRNIKINLSEYAAFPDSTNDVNILMVNLKLTII